MHYQTTRGTLFRKSVEVIQPILYDGRLIFTRAAIHIEGVTKTTSVSYVMPHTTAEVCSLTGNVALSHTVDITVLLNWLKLVNPGDIISFTSAENTLTFEHWNSTRRTKLVLSSPSSASPPVESTQREFASSVTVPSKYLEESVKRHSFMSPRIFISTVSDKPRDGVLLRLESGKGRCAHTVTSEYFATGTTTSVYARGLGVTVKGLLKVARAHNLAPNVVISQNPRDYIEFKYQTRAGVLVFRLLQTEDAKDAPPTPSKEMMPPPPRPPIKRRPKKKRKVDPLPTRLSQSCPECGKLCCLCKDLYSFYV